MPDIDSESGFLCALLCTGIWLSMKEASREVESESKKLEKDSLESAVREAISVLSFSNGSKRSSWLSQHHAPGWCVLL